MKLIKELPISIINSLRLRAMDIKKLKNPTKEEVPVIVSLTSIPSRIKTLHLVIRSLMDQTKKPKKIVLWLNEDLKTKLPGELKTLECDFFEIAYSKLNCSHRKLIHSLVKFPNDIIVTCDDDLMYRRNWLSTIYDEHLKNPDCIIGNHCVHIKHDENGNPLPFKKWRISQGEVINKRAFVPIGAWGILYPPNSLSEQVTDSNLFLKLAPKADDLWFKAMAILEDTLSIQAEKIPLQPIPIAGTQKVALKKQNLGLDKNTEQWNSLNNHFNLSTIIQKKTP